MVKRPARKPVKRAPKESSFEKGIENFSEEMEGFGERMEKKFHRKGCGCPMGAFGLLWPAISAVFGLLLLGVMLWFLGFVAAKSGSSVIYGIRGFFADNLGMIFLLLLFFSYASHLSKWRPRLYRPFEPLFAAAGVTGAIWIMLELLMSFAANIIPGLPAMEAYAVMNLAWIFIVLVLIGYLMALVGTIACGSGSCCAVENREVKKVMKTVSKPAKGKRLYRSGEEKILGGVCGGLAEYLSIDPVIVRLGWVCVSLLWGAGILLYIIAWIIIPRNPEHRW